MTLFKTSFFSGIETILKLLTGLFIVKYLALKEGPEAIAILGQFQNFYSAVLILIGGAFSTGLVKLTTEYKSDNDGFRILFNKSLAFLIVFSCVFSVILFVFSEKISNVFLYGSEFTRLIQFFSVFLFCNGLFVFSISILNGLGEIKKYIISKISQSLFILLSTIVLINFYGASGVFISIVFAGFVSCMVPIYLLYGIYKERGIQFRPDFEGFFSNRLWPYWFMAFATVISSPVIMVFIREAIIESFGMEYAGYWEAILKLSELYLIVITTALIVYFIPKIGGSVSIEETKKLVNKIVVFSLLMALFCSLIIYNLRDFFIYFLFDESFYAISEYVGIALIVSVVKVVSWVYSYYFIAKGRAVFFIVTEIEFGILLCFLTFLGINLYGFIGVFYASLANSIIFLCYLYYFYKKEVDDYDL